MTANPNAAEFTRLLDYLKATRGFDFGAYKVSSLMRRVQKRMREVGIESYGAYTEYLEVHPQEFEPLFDTVLINVTSFFRDPLAWQYLAEHVVPRIVEEKGEGPIRVWSAGCASGEEAYTLAILLAETLGEEPFRKRVKIYATDVDEDALAKARLGSFEAKQVGEVPPELLEKYFERQGSRHVFRAGLRRNLIFGRLDLLQDAAISRLDLLVCRNTLMYFNSDAQDKILARFHFALNKAGTLFLGKAETLLANNGSFRPLDLKNRIFVRTGPSNLRQRMRAIAPAPAPATAAPNGANRALELRDAAFAASPTAQIVVDRQGHLLLANEQARRLFSLSPADLGVPLRDLELSYRPADLRSPLEEAMQTRAPVQVKEVEWRPPGLDPQNLEIRIEPLADAKGTLLGASVAFVDLTQARQLRTVLERANRDLETASEELQSANEELETTNEELQSTVEELETTNEELQSANEELETMNAELQSTNDELNALNDQLEERSEELNRVNGYFQSVLSGLNAAVAVLDRDLQVRVWSDKAEDLWGLRKTEVAGKPFTGLDIGLPVGEVQPVLSECLAKSREAEIQVKGLNRRGKSHLYRVRCTPVSGPTGVTGLILLMEEGERARE